MQGLMLHCGGVPVTFEELGGFEIPPETETYKPVGHQDLVRMAEERTRVELDYDGAIDWSHGVNKEGKQYFGLGRLVDRKLTEQQCLTMGLRGSYDKSMSNAIAFGANCFVCDNMSFWGSLITVMRKHTKNVFRDMRRLIMEALEGAEAEAQKQARKMENWNQWEVTQDEGYEIIGRMRGNGLLTPTITNDMFRAWQKPSQEIFEDRNMWSLYNASTEAMKRTTPSRVLQTYSGVFDFFQAEVDELQAA